MILICPSSWHERDQCSQAGSCNPVRNKGVLWCAIGSFARKEIKICKNTLVCEAQCAICEAQCICTQGNEEVQNTPTCEA
eukprot:jgi/Botrbrau1/21738/Bobra.43_1s0132.1